MSRIFLLYILVFSTVGGDWRTNIVRSFGPDPAQEDLELLLAQTIYRSFESINCITVFTDDTSVYLFGKVFHSAVERTPIFVITIDTEEDLLAPNYKTLKLVKSVRKCGCRVIVIFLKNGEQVGRFLRFSDRHRELDTRANFILLHDQRLLQPELHFLWKKIVNVVFLRKFAGRPGIRPWYEIFTVPYPAPVGEVMHLRRIDLWRGGNFKQNSLLFRDKTSDLRTEMLKVVTFQHIPATYKAPAPSIKQDVTLEGTDAIGYTGVEIEILSTLSRIMNFETYLYEPPGDERWGQVSTNGSHTGLLGEMATGFADIALGDLHHTPHNLKFMDLTIPYTTQCLTFLTPEALTDNSWQTLLLPFKTYMWTGVLVSLVTGSITFFVLAKFHEHMESTSKIQVIKSKDHKKPLTLHNNLTPDPSSPLVGLFQFSTASNSLLYTFSMLLLVSLPKLPDGWSLRVLTGCWWLYSILVIVAYRASMTAILANPAPRVTIDTLEKLAESKIAAGGWDEQTKKFFQTSLDSAGKIVGSRFEIERNIDVAVSRVAKGEFAFYENIYFLQFASLRRHILAMKEGRRAGGTQETTRNLHIMSNCVINMPISIGLQKNSPLKPRVDRYLRLIVQCGLTQKWLRDAMAQVQTADSTADDSKSAKAFMDLKKFLGAVVALGAGYMISTLALLIEFIYWRFTVYKHPNYDKYSHAIVINKKVNNKSANRKSGALKTQ